MARTFEHELVEPIEVDGKTITRLVLRRPKGRDIEAMEREREAGGDMAATFALIASITGLSLEAVRDMDFEDISTVGEVLMGFIPATSGNTLPSGDP